MAKLVEHEETILLRLLAETIAAFPTADRDGLPGRWAGGRGGIEEEKRTLTVALPMAQQWSQVARTTAGGMTVYGVST